MLWKMWLYHLGVEEQLVLQTLSVVYLLIRGRKEYVLMRMRELNKSQSSLSFNNIANTLLKDFYCPLIILYLYCNTTLGFI